MGERLEEAALRLLSRAGEEWALAIESRLPLAMLVAASPCRTRPLRRGPEPLGHPFRPLQRGAVVSDTMGGTGPLDAPVFIHHEIHHERI